MPLIWKGSRSSTRKSSALKGLTKETTSLFLMDTECNCLIHETPKQVADQIEIKSPPERRFDTALKFFFPVDSIEKVRVKLLVSWAVLFWRTSIRDQSSMFGMSQIPREMFFR